MQVRNCQVHFPFSIWMSLCQKIWKLAKKRNELESSTQPLKSHQENCWKCIFSCNELQLDKKKFQNSGVIHKFRIIIEVTKTLKEKVNSEAPSVIEVVSGTWVLVDKVDKLSQLHSSSALQLSELQ